MTRRPDAALPSVPRLPILRKPEDGSNDKKAQPADQQRDDGRGAQGCEEDHEQEDEAHAACPCPKPLSPC